MMKKLLGIVVLGLLLSGNGYAKKGDIKIILKDINFIRIKLDIGIFHMGQKDYWKAMKKVESTAVSHCKKQNKTTFILAGKINGEDKLYRDWSNINSHIYTMFCAKNLTQAVNFYYKYNFPDLFDNGPELFATDVNTNVRSVVTVLEEEKRKKEIELAKKRAEEKRRLEAIEKAKKVAEQKKLAEANKNNTQPSYNSTSKERVKQVVSYKGGVAMKGFLGGLIGMALGFGLYSIMDRKIKKKINDKYFLGGAFFIGWIISKFL